MTVYSSLSNYYKLVLTVLKTSVPKVIQDKLLDIFKITRLALSRFFDLRGNLRNFEETPGISIFPPIDWPLKFDYSSLYNYNKFFNGLNLSFVKDKLFLKTVTPLFSKKGGHGLKVKKVKIADELISF